MPENICRCQKIFADARKYMQMPDNICRCQTIFADARKYLQMHIGSNVRPFIRGFCPQGYFQNHKLEALKLSYFVPTA